MAENNREMTSKFPLDPVGSFLPKLFFVVESRYEPFEARW